MKLYVTHLITVCWHVGLDFLRQIHVRQHTVTCQMTVICVMTVVRTSNIIKITFLKVCVDVVTSQTESTDIAKKIT